MNTFSLRKFSLFMLALLSFFSSPNFASEKKERNLPFLTLADIHFDPFYSCKTSPCPLILELQKMPADRWPQRLPADERQEYSRDSNYSLLTNLLTHANKVAKDEKAQFVLILGDYLGHSFKRLYKKYSNDKKMIGYESFVRKTLEFLVHELALTFPQLDVYPVIGNNDSYQENYYTETEGLFFRDFTDIWSPLIHDPVNLKKFQSQFSQEGAYAINLPQSDRAQLFVLNSTFFSSKARGKGVKKGALNQLNWLKTQLTEAKERGHVALIAMHIPPRFDLYLTTRFRLMSLFDFWEKKYSHCFESILNTNASMVGGVMTGHLHFNWFHLQTIALRKLAMSGTAAVSPIFLTNPGFKVVSFSPAKNELSSLVTYNDALGESRVWQKWKGDSVH